jgi:hypothetical protein
MFFRISFVPDFLPWRGILLLFRIWPRMLELIFFQERPAPVSSTIIESTVTLDDVGGGWKL